MQNTVLGSLALLAATLAFPRAGQAQGTMLYLSSLSQTFTGSAAVGSDSWLAARFITGNNLGGYTLDSIQLGMTDALGNPSGFAVMLYTNSGSAQAILPGRSLGSLAGSASPSSAAVYSYAPAGSLTLSPRTYYFVVATAATAVANGAYNLALSAYPPPIASDGWGEGNAVLRSTDGASGWSPTLPYQGIGQLAIYATPIPEPGVLSLAVLGGLLLLRYRR